MSDTVSPALDLDRAVRPIEELLDALIDDERCHAREAHSDYRSDRRVSEYDADRKKSRAALLDAIRAALVERQTDTERLDWLEREAARGERGISIGFTEQWTEHGECGAILSSGPREFWLRDDGDECGSTLREAIDAARRARSAVVGVEGGQ